MKAKTRVAAHPAGALRGRSQYQNSALQGPALRKGPERVTAGKSADREASENSRSEWSAPRVAAEPGMRRSPGSHANIVSSSLLVTLRNPRSRG